MLEPGRTYPDSTKQITVDFRNSSGTLFDPTTVVFKLYSPGGVETTYTYGEDSECQKTATGQYVAYATLDEPGRWFYQWVITSGSPEVTSIAQGNVIVRNTPFYSGSDTAYAI
jgi:hypothetical protein